MQVRHPGEDVFVKTTQKYLKQLWGTSIGQNAEPRNDLEPGTNVVLKASLGKFSELISSDIPPMSEALTRSLSQLIAHPEWRRTHIVNPNGQPLVTHPEPLRWVLTPPAAAEDNYELTLRDPVDAVPSRPIAILTGAPLQYVTEEAVYPLAYWPFGNEFTHWPVRIPAAAIESKEGITALTKLGVAIPSRLEGRVKIVGVEIQVRCRIQNRHSTDYFQLQADTKFPGIADVHSWNGSGWNLLPPPLLKSQNATNEILHFEKSTQLLAANWLAQLTVKPSSYSREGDWLEERIQGKDWPETIIAWLDRRPKGITVEIDAELASLRDGRVAGKVRLDIEESRTGIDWFDLSVALDVSDHTLSQEEIELLLKAKGKWVRLVGKGWRKLEFQLSEEEIKELAELGLAVNDFGSEKQRLHALQLGGLARNETTLLSAERVEQVRRRVDEIQTRVTPALPDGITATLRPYQTEGFHFLSYLTTNRFGGVLADDMGLGKTLQTLAWIAWLRAEKKVTSPILVVCPKSVQDNWRAEALRFFPSLTLEVWDRTNAGETGLKGEVDLLIIHYAQLRLFLPVIGPLEWGAVILDEAQAIKNPGSQISHAACGLKSNHRLALTGTPIENRLLDLWSIFAFAMPGVLGNRASFARDFDTQEDPFSRRRLAARTRPFLLRRTKNEVARDLPDRVEEDITVELEGTQAALYQAEVKRARAQLMNVETSKQLDKLRFNILTSLLRLRQICCHPQLVGLGAQKARKSSKKTEEPLVESAKMTALMEMLEPLMEQGLKVLIFSQFVEMLALLETEINARGWKSFKLTGHTEERGTLVNAFQEYDGSASFLISLKAGGSGLNLTAASYVILFDPWWNPAVEAQAIDRTHRIGQKQTVFAYRLIVKNSVEEKIRQLQKQKGALASDILGEENFAKALTIKDFQFLLGEE